MSINEIDTMTLIMPSGPGRPRAAALDTAAAGGAAAGGGGGGGGKVRNKTFYTFLILVFFISLKLITFIFLHENRSLFIFLNGLPNRHC